MINLPLMLRTIPAIVSLSLLATQGVEAIGKGKSSSVRLRKDVTPVYLPQHYSRHPNEARVYFAGQTPLELPHVLNEDQIAPRVQLFTSTPLRLRKLGLTSETNISDNRVQPVWVITVPAP